MRIVSICTLLAFLLISEICLSDISQIEEAKYTVKSHSLEVRPFSLTQVRILDGPFKHAMEKDGEYLLALDPDRLLSWFRKEAGLKPKKPNYGGWEAMGIAGHSLGHYLSAISMMYASSGDERFLEKATYTVDEMALCQEANGNGYLEAFADGKKVFEEISRGEIRSAGFDLNGIWVPWYTTHKIMAGLRDVWLCCGNEKALNVLIGMCDWSCEITKNLTDGQWQKMLNCEHGGMNEVLADVYAITGDKKYLDLSKKFYHKYVLDPLADREDRLAGLHANTQIPKVIGAARIYELTGEDRFATIASFFWDQVVYHHSYVNGGNSAGEYFNQPDQLNNHMNDTTETCNTYNMLKLTRHLYAWKPRSVFMDYYERALYNHILAHQNPETGMLMYKGFLDMPAVKHFSTPFNSFWCCVGTGMENHAKYGDTIYFHNEDTLYVNLFIASELTWKEKGLVLRQETTFPEGDAIRLELKCDKPVNISIKIRRPFWAEEMTVKRNGKTNQAVPGCDGYIRLDGPIGKNETIEIQLPKPLYLETMPDNHQRIAFFSGPILLAADLDGETPLPLLVGNKQKMLCSLRSKDEKPLQFTLTDFVQELENPEELSKVKLLPLYQVVDQKYTVYMDAFTPEGWKNKKTEYEEQKKKQQELEARTLDYFIPGRMQDERDHNFTGEKIETGQHMGRSWRHAVDGGWMEFDMKVDQNEPADLSVTYWGGDVGARMFDILVEGTKIGEQSLNNNRPGKFYDVVYNIPFEITQNKSTIKVRFQAHPGNIAGGIYGCRTIRREE